jgi:prepilin-type N-terminal cleavage/methylation domain-containing protein
MLRPIFLRRFGRDIGFTLTELVIAMLVLGVLASVAIPSFLGARNNSYDKEAQASVEVVLRAAKLLYQSQGDFSNGSSAQCGDSAVLAADLQKLEPNVDVVASSVSSTSSRVVSVQAVQTWNSNAELLGCQGFYAVALSSSGSCWAVRFVVEGKFLRSSSISPVVVNAQTNTSNKAVTTWTALAVNGHAFGVLKPQTSAADGDNTNGLTAIKTACKAKTHSTGSPTVDALYIAPSQFYASWRDVGQGGTASNAVAPICATGGTCVVGDAGPGGGVVFYVAASNFTSTGSDCNTACKYLEAAPVDLGADVIPWVRNVMGVGVAKCYAIGSDSGSSNCAANSIYPDSDDQSGSRTASTAIGMGMTNTNKIYDRLTTAGSDATSTYAAGLAWAYSNNGKTDWYLPSKDEMNQVCKWAYGQDTSAANQAVACNPSNTASLSTSLGVSGFEQTAGYWSSSESDADKAWFMWLVQGFRAGVSKDSNNYRLRPIRAVG